MKSFASALFLGLSAIVLSPSTSHAEEQSAIAATGPDGSKDYYRQLIIDINPRQVPLESPDAPMRQALLLDQAEKILIPDSLPVGALLSDPEAEIDLRARLTVDTEGTVSDCRFFGEPKLPVSQDAFCAWLGEKPRFRPALNQQGERVEGEASIWLLATRASVEKGKEAPGLFGQLVNMPALSPPSPTPPAVPDSFPPASDWLQWYAGPYRTNAELAIWDDATDADAKHVGLIFGGEGADDPGCRIMESSGDRKLDSEACDYVEQQVRPVWNARFRSYQRHAVLLIRETDDGLQAIGRRQPNYQRLEPKAELRRELYDRMIAETGATPVTGPTNLWAAFLLDAEGRATQCQIRISSGSDEGDLRACAILREKAWFVPGRDIFGRRAAGGYAQWIASGELSALEQQ